jgi:hypothetical protein
MPTDPEKKDPFDEMLKQQRETALKALTMVIEKYSPAETKEVATTFFSTNDICDSIAEHTGVILHPSEIFEMMQNMNYKFEAFGELELKWMLKKD